MAGNREVYEQAMRAAFDHSWNQNWKAAIEGYKQALTEFPTDVAATLGLGGAFLELNRFKAAQKAFERAVQLAPDNPEALAGLAEAHERLGAPNNAAASYDQAGHFLIQQGKLEEAADALIHATRLAPSQAEFHLNLIQVLEQLGRSQQAATEYVALASIARDQDDGELAMEYCQQALRLDPDSNQAQSLLQSLEEASRPAPIDLDYWDASAPPEPAPSEPAEEGFFSIGELEDEEELAGSDHSPMGQAQRKALQELADMLFELGTDGGPDMNTVSTIGQAIDQQTRGLLNDAIENYSKVLNSGLTRSAVFFNLGMLYYQSQRYDEAVESFRRSMRDKDYTLGSHYALGLTYREAGYIDRSLEHFIEVVKTVDLGTVSPDRTDNLNSTYEQLSDRYIARGETEEANTFIDVLLDFFSEKGWERKAIEARRRMDSLAQDNGGPSTLAEYLESPETGVIVTTMVLTSEYIQRNMLMTAAEECFRAIQKAPDYLPIHVRLADIFLKQGHSAKAITKYLTIADVYQMRGEYQRGIEIYERILRLAPMDVQVRAKLIDLLITRGQADQALEQYLILADAYYQLAQIDHALERYNEALQLAPSSAKEVTWKVDILHRMGDIYNQRVDWDRATKAYESIVAVAPDDERAQLALVDLYYKKGEKERALQTLDNLLELYQNAGKTQKILEVLQDAVQMRPEEMGLRARLAATYAQQGMARQAITEYDALGEMQLEAGLREEAARTIQTIIELGPDDVEGYRRLYSQIKGGGL